MAKKTHNTQSNVSCPQDEKFMRAFLREEINAIVFFKSTLPVNIYQQLDSDSQPILKESIARKEKYRRDADVCFWFHLNGTASLKNVFI